MRKNDINNAFSRITADDGMKERILNAMEEKGMKRAKIKRGRYIAAIAACVAALGVTTAFAGQQVVSSIMSYFSNDKAREMTSLAELAKYNEEIGTSMTKNGITLTLDNIAADDNFVHVFYTITSDKPLYTGDDPYAPDVAAEEISNVDIECVINGRLAMYGRNHNSEDGYFIDNCTYKAACKYNVAQDVIPDKFKVEIYMGDYDSEAMLKLYQNKADEITDEDKAQIWYVSADADKSAVEVETFTKDINVTLASGVSVDKVVFSPFGNQLVVSNDTIVANDGYAYNLFGGFALYDENDTSLDILNTDMAINADGRSTNSFEFLKADINTKQLKIVPFKSKPHDEADVISQKIGQYPIRYEMGNGYGSVVITDVRFSDGVIAIDYYKDGFILYDPGFYLMNDAGENVEPGGKLGCVLYIDVHHETNSYTARYVYDALDEDGNKIPADESVSEEALAANFTTLGVVDLDDVTLDFDNAVVVDLK